ncbi:MULTISPECIES: SIR2 family protein [unclassified Sedimentibacter]|uniref:SIR2 family protein n=1 Tax=unclassified Sedimentibacter TaxID=2649220 RepID=UPI0027E19F16|nr:SIR2 family protein [Sedimentibacter sp. MB35-C1]WMJ76360.1 SIR2 family protein [Sedimentibacter sp. MB35-C1]
MFKEMQSKLKTVGIAPIFFIGSGISRRYINSPNWIGLLKEVVEDRDINFTKLVQKYTDSSNVVNNEQLAQELEDIYFDKLNDDEIEDGGNKPYYFRKKISNIIEKYLIENIDKLDNNTEIIEFKNTRPAAIITTNYDRLLENIYGNEYSVLIGQDSLLGSVLDGVGEIYKIHGCASSPNSIVITEKDYNNFFYKNKYLNAKLLTLFLEYPIIFMGYSISDRNIISILSTIFEMLSPEKVEELKSRIWFIQQGDQNKKTTVRINLNEGHYMDINSFVLSDYSKLYSAISDISIKKLPIKFLKFLKSNLYELIASQEYNPKLLDVNVRDLENINDFDEVSEFVGLTFSTEKRIAFCNNENLCKAFLQSDKLPYYIEKDLLNYRRNNIVPFYKFLANLTFEELMSYVKNDESRFYKNLLDDKFDYKIFIGKELKVNFNSKLTKRRLNEYANNFVEENGLQSNQMSSVIRYVILQLLNSNIANVIEPHFFIKDYSKEIVKVMTHLSDDFIRKNEFAIFKILNSLIIKDKSEHNFRYLLCHIDRAIYRNKIINN